MPLIAEFVSTSMSFDYQWGLNVGYDESYDSAYISVIADSQNTDLQMLFRSNPDNTVLSTIGGKKKNDEDTAFITSFRHLLMQTQAQFEILDMIEECYIVTNVWDYENGDRKVFMCMWVDDEVWWAITEGPRFEYVDGANSEPEIQNYNIIAIDPELVDNEITEFELVDRTVEDGVAIEHTIIDNPIVINDSLKIWVLYRTWYELFGDVENIKTI